MTALIVIWVVLLAVLAAVYFFPPYKTSRDMVKLYRVRARSEGPKGENEPKDQGA